MNNHSLSVWREKVLFAPQKEDKIPVVWPEKKTYHKDIIVEIGFGNGQFLGLLAQNNPDSLILGFDISLESCVRAVKKCRDENLINVLIMKENAKPMLRELFADNSIDKIYMNFPDPWPKRKHEIKRTLNNGFIAILAAVLKKNGYFELVTDQEWYGEQSRDLFHNSKYFTIEEFQKNPQREFQTKYEKKWLALSRNIYRLLVQKKAFYPVTRLISGENMPHVIIEQKLPADKIADSLMELENKNESALFKVKEIHRNIRSEDFLLRMVAVDDDIIQKFYIIIQKRENGWIVKLEDITQPFRTPSVKKAVSEIGRILGEL